MGVRSGSLEGSLESLLLLRSCSVPHEDTGRQPEDAQSCPNLAVDSWLQNGESGLLLKSLEWLKLTERGSHIIRGAWPSAAQIGVNRNFLSTAHFLSQKVLSEWTQLAAGTLHAASRSMAKNSCTGTEGQWYRAGSV